MGVDVTYFKLVGLKEDFMSIKDYESKNSSDFMFDLSDGDTKKYKYIIFEDYLRDDYKVIRDGMCAEYSFIGKIISSSYYMDEIPETSLSISELTSLINEVYEELCNLGITCNKDEIKFYSFPHFS